MPNIHQIYIHHKNFQINVVISSIPFYHFAQMINSCVVLCDHRDATRSISTFTLAVTILLSTRKFIISTQCIFLSFVVQNTIMLCNSCQLSFCTVIRRHTQNQLNTSLQATPTQSGTLCPIFCHSCMQLSHIWIHLRLTKNACLELSSVLSQHLSFLPISLSAYPKCMLTPTLSKITKLFYTASTPLSASMCSLCDKPNKQV